jgi:flagellar operon protein
MAEPINPALIPPGISGPADPVARPRPVRAPSSGPSFQQVLDGVSFSKHATQRVERRQLSVDAPTLERLNAGVDRAAGKGSRDAVVFVDDTAFVVSVANRTVVTAVGRDQLRDHVFTNIDSAVIA